VTPSQSRPEERCQLTSAKPLAASSTCAGQERNRGSQALAPESPWAPAGVDMRLEAGAVRELHWHKEGQGRCLSEGESMTIYEGLLEDLRADAVV
jgi:hypothetical protein